MGDRRVLFAMVAFAMVFGCGDKVTTVMRTTTPTPEATATGALATATVTVPAAETSTPTLDPTAFPTGTPAGTSDGPVVTHLGLAQADDRPIEASGTDSLGRPIFERELGTGLTLVVEGRSGADGRPVGEIAFSDTGLPDLQILVSRPLGDGSAAVCDVDPEGENGGVPASDPPVFSDSAMIRDAINDLGCRVNNGQGDAVARKLGDACTRFADGSFGFVDSASQVQFCLPIARAWAFPQGDTIVAARVRNVVGNVGDAREIVVRIQRELPPLPTVPAVTATPTPTPVPPLVTFLGVAAPDDAILVPSGTDDEGRDVYTRLIGHAISLVVEVAPGGSRGVGQRAFSSDGQAPDLQILVSRDLGDGNPEVCDVDVENEIFGGVPATDPLDFAFDAATVAAMNDLGCRVNDGAGEPRGRGLTDPCTRDRFGNFTFISERTDTQFCLPIARAWQFQPGDTIVAARVRSIDGELSQVREIVIRVAGDGREDCEPEGLGARVFSLAANGSELRVAPLDMDVSSDWTAEPVLLCAGEDDDGVHSLRLLRDARIAASVADGNVACVKLFADGSEGVLDCAGVEGHGVRHSEDGVSGEVDLAVGLGDPAGMGSATLRVPVAFQVLPSPAGTTDCFATQFGSPSMYGLTTGTAEAVVTNSSHGGTISLALPGEPFDCQRWRTDDGPGKLAMPVPSTIDSLIGDTASIFVFDD